MIQAATGAADRRCVCVSFRLPTALEGSRLLHTSAGQHGIGGAPSPTGPRLGHIREAARIEARLLPVVNCNVASRRKGPRYRTCIPGSDGAAGCPHCGAAGTLRRYRRFIHLSVNGIGDSCD